jgi:hypothetical protein
MFRKASRQPRPQRNVGSAIFGGAVLVRADDDCQKRINKADYNLHEAIEHHGVRREPAEHWRHELAEARSYCWDHNHRWWDGDANRWRTDRDWDDHDHGQYPHK